jgi:hypothetical protein
MTDNENTLRLLATMLLAAYVVLTAITVLAVPAGIVSIMCALKIAQIVSRNK